MNNPFSEKDFMNFPYLNIIYSFASFLFKDLLLVEIEISFMQQLHFKYFILWISLWKNAYLIKSYQKLIFIMEKCPNQYGKTKSDQR
jgi:hypothetical protein